MTRLVAIAGLALVLSLSGCDDPPLVKSTAKPRVAGGAAADASGAPAAPVTPRTPIDETEFVESERGRDPFRSFARTFVEESKGRTRSQREVILGEYSLDELKLIGIVTRAAPAKAMLVDPNGKGYVIQRGQFVGRADLVQTGGRSGATYEINWRVDRIRDGDVVFVREDPRNPDVPTVTRVIPLRPEGSIVDKTTAELTR